MAREKEVRDDSIASDDYLPDLAAQVRHGSTEAFQGEGWSVGALGAALRQRAIGEPRRDGRGEISLLPGVPERLETSCREDRGIGLGTRQRRVHGQR